MKPMMMQGLAAAAVLLLLANCAQTTFYHNGQKVAAFSADMTGMDYSSSPDGSIHWQAEEVSHSSAVLAQGKAASGLVGALGASVAGTRAASGLMGVLKR